MKAIQQSLQLSLYRPLACLMIGLATHSVQAEPRPDGIAVVTSLKGDVRIINALGETIRPQLHSEHALSQNTIETDHNAYLFLALSNGLGIGINQSSKVKITQYTQQPFEAEKENLDFEPSESEFNIEIEFGTLAISSEGLSPLSKAQIKTPEGTLRVHSGSSSIICDTTGTTVCAYRGNATFYYPDQLNRSFISGPSCIRISPQSYKVAKVAERIPMESLPQHLQRFTDATRHASQRVLFRASTSKNPVEPILVVPKKHFNQATKRPYQYND